MTVTRPKPFNDEERQRIGEILTKLRIQNYHIPRFGDGEETTNEQSLSILRWTVTHPTRKAQIN